MGWHDHFKFSGTLDIKRVCIHLSALDHRPPLDAHERDQMWSRKPERAPRWHILTHDDDNYFWEVGTGSTCILELLS